MAAAERRREGRARDSTAAAGTMPVHSREKKENNHDEMEVDYGENEGSSSEEDETESSSVSEEGDSSGTAAAHKAAPLRGRRGGSLSARCCPGDTPVPPRLWWLPVSPPSPPPVTPPRPSPCFGSAASLRAPGQGAGTGRGSRAESPREPRAAGSGAGWHPAMADWAALLRSVEEPGVVPCCA